MNINWKYIALILVALVASELFYLSSEGKRIEDLRMTTVDIYATSISLEQELGFGGLIHNFKNYVLRPEEKQYATLARKNASHALNLIEKLETISAEMGNGVTLPETRKIVDTYTNNLNVIADLNTQGVAPFDVDKSVRVHDDFALEEIDRFTSSTTNAVNDRLRKLEAAIKTQLQIIFGLLMFGVLYFCITLNGIATQSAKLSKSNGALSDSNASLSRSNLALRQFAGIASHDLKSPIRHISLSSDMLKQDIDTPEKVSGHINAIKQAAERMHLLCSSLLEFTKSGFQKPEISRLNANAIIADTIKEMVPEIKLKGADIQQCSAPIIDADPVLLKRVFHNLIANSLKYSHDDRQPKVIIQCDTNAKTATFSVTDNGIGIAPEYSERIFEPMERLHGKDSKYPGVGIGLSLVKSIIESHGGVCWLDVKYSQGTRICFTLPISK